MSSFGKIAVKPSFPSLIQASLTKRGGSICPAVRVPPPSTTSYHLLRRKSLKKAMRFPPVKCDVFSWCLFHKWNTSCSCRESGLGLPPPPPPPLEHPGVLRVKFNDGGSLITTTTQSETRSPRLRLSWSLIQFSDRFSKVRCSLPIWIVIIYRPQYVRDRGRNPSSEIADYLAGTRKHQAS